jgi:hypothetical protein
MNLPRYWGYILFFAVPIVLWLIGVIAIKRRPLVVRLLSVVAGSDNRLSLSRLQAFAWTLVIFGSFAAAMAVHTHIGVGTAIETRQKNEAAKRVFDNADASLTTASVDLAKAKKELDDATAAWTAADDEATKSRILVVGSNENGKSAAEKRAADDKKSADIYKAQKDHLEELYLSKLSTRNQAQGDKNKAEIALNSASTDWVQIPNALLALTGIAIGSGVFSSLIAGVNSDSKTACVTSLQVVGPDELKARFKDANADATKQGMIIEGEDLGTSGRVRTGKQVLPLLYWSKDGTAVAVDLSKIMGKPFNDIILETANGKLAYEVTWPTQKPMLGLPKFSYDLADLFRDDKNPSIVSLMKFQMFGWTVVAIGIYSWIFLTNVSPYITSLPPVDQSIVILTGLSQGGYLAGKAVSNVGNSDSKLQSGPN